MAAASWHFPRAKLARSYLTLFSLGPGEPLTLFSPRRTGKTTFLQYDLVPLAVKEGYFPVYVDLWQDRLEPLQAVLYALEQALDDLTVPKTVAGRRLATSVKKVAVLGSSIDFGAEPARTKPKRPYLEMDFLLREIVRSSRKPVLLLLDEVQQLAADRQGDAIVAALRSTLTKHRGKVFTLFTGSSEDRLRELFMRAKAPLYEFSSHIVFPLLDREFVRFIGTKFENATTRSLAEEQLWRAFVAFDQRPKPFIDLVVDMMKDGATDIDRYLKRHLAGRDKQAGHAALWASLRPLQQQVLMRIALGKVLSSGEALTAYGKALGIPRVSPGSVHYALRQLREQDAVVSGGGRGDFRLESAAFASWIRSHVV